MADEHNFPPEPVERRRVPAGQAMVVVLVSLLVGAVLNADRIDTTAHSQPFGWQRTWALRFTGPVKALSDTIRLNRPREVVSETAGNELEPPPKDTGSVVTAPPTVPDATTTTSAPPVLRTPTAEAPVRILVAGDSLMGWIGPALSSGLDGKPVTVTEDWKVGSGLARPDVINWPAKLEQDMAAHDPEVVVVGFGGNDAQDMVGSDGRVGRGSPEWAAEYQRRAAQILNAVEGPNRTVYWIGLPITTRRDIEDVAPAMAKAIKTEIAARPWAHYVDTQPTLSPDGTYTAYLPDGSGGNVKVRENDGVHPNLAGARRIVAPLVAALVKERKLG
ncbi:MAG: hypothetical protein JWM47_3958 [Acidimicrobiales bacterium]|nr:hypothetical protein [Acidimicrobiales bacterium]